MRIIIETDQAPAATIDQSSTQLERTLITTDAGGPSETLLQSVGTAPAQVITMKGKATGAALPVREGIDAGTPPDWLVQALQNAPGVGTS